MMNRGIGARKIYGSSGLLALCVGCFSVLTSFAAPAICAEYRGVDETVVEKIAREHGREAREPLVGKEQGDLLLFAFLAAGAAGGFAAGYYWRMLTEGKGKKDGEIRERGGEW
jgi:hypothetical protein